MVLSVCVGVFVWMRALTLNAGSPERHRNGRDLGLLHFGWWTEVTFLGKPLPWRFGRVVPLHVGRLYAVAEMLVAWPVGFQQICTCC